jgi:hypothetical protein
MEILKTIKNRWCAETPNFFKGIQKFAISLGSSATAVWVANDTMSLGLHPTVLDVCKYLIAISAAIGVTSQLTQVQPSEPQK